MLLISQENAQEFLNYLAQRPYVEVFGFIQVLQNLQPVEEKAPDSPEDVSEESSENAAKESK